MKKLLLGNAAVAQGAYEAGVKVVVLSGEGQVNMNSADNVEKTEKQPICRRTKWEKIPAKGIFWKLVGKRLEVVLFCLRRDSCNYTDCNI